MPRTEAATHEKPVYTKSRLPLQICLQQLVLEVRGLPASDLMPCNISTRPVTFWWTFSPLRGPAVHEQLITCGRPVILHGHRVSQRSLQFMFLDCAASEQALKEHSPFMLE